MDNINQSIYFLKKWAPPPWHLSAIDPKTGKFEGAYLKDEAETRKWLEQRVQSKNIYFMVNELLHEVKTKAKKTDIKSVGWLHVDVDPRPGEDFKEERVRALKVLREFDPPPTVIIDSGGGYQGFWKLEEPFVMNGDIAKASEIEAYNKQIELLLHGDNCFNVDRIMRLPGTINLPNKKKMAKGRTAQPAKIVETHWDREYPLGAFTPAQKIQGSGGDSGGPHVVIPGNLSRLSSVEDLPDTVRPHTKLVIVQGDDPDDPNKYDSRSEALFAVLCDLIRANVPIDVIASVIMDPDFGISSSILDKLRPEDYAARQIARAIEFVKEPWLMKLNEHYAVVLHDGGKCRVIKEVMDYALDRPRLMRITFEDFRNAYRNKKVIVGKDTKGYPVEKPVGHWWLDNPDRREYETIVFAPNREIENVYNLWRGFAVEAVPGGGHETFLEHIKENICGGDQETYNYVIKWMARTVQKPASNGEVAIVLRGARGTGKSFFAKNFGQIFGRHFLHVSNSHHLVGNFNAHLRDCVVLFADEAFYAGDKRHESTLKTLITEDTLVIEAKGLDAIQSPNYTHLLMASNDDWVVPAGPSERRFLVLDVSDHRQKDTEYFGAIQKSLNSGGKENLLHFLLNVDLSDFDVRQVPSTQALREQKQRTMKGHEHVFLEILAEAITPDPDELKDNSAQISVQAIVQKMDYTNIRGLETMVGHFLRQQAEVNAEGKPIVISKRWNGRRVRLYKLKPLSELRESWAEYADEWPADGNEWHYRKPENGNQDIPF